MPTSGPDRPATDRPLRLLVVAPGFPAPPSHGGAFRIYHHVRHLARRGVRVFLLTLTETGPAPEHRDALESWCEVVRAVPRHPTWTGRSVRLFAFRKYHVAALARAIRELDRLHRFDVVQLEYTQMGVYHDVPARPVARILVEHDVSFVTLWRRARLTRGWRRLPALLRAGLALGAERAIVRRMTRVVAMSEVDAGVLRRVAPGLRTVVVPNGVDLDEEPFVADWSPGATLLFVGNFRHGPNTEGVLAFAGEIYPRVRARAPGVEWLIAGPEPPPAVQAQATPGSGVSVLGHVDDLTACFARSRVFVAPVLRGSGTRVKILQAMARGVPVVTTTVGAEGLAVTPGGDVLVGDTPEAFAEQVLRLLGDPVLAETLRRRARTLVETRYDVSAQVETLLQVYRAACAEVAAG